MMAVEERTVREGYKMTELGEIPVEWEVVDLDSVKNDSDKYSFSGGPFGSDLTSKEYTHSGVQIIQLQNIGEGKFNNNYRVFTDNQKADDLKKCNIYPGDIVIAKMAHPVARACIVPNDMPRYLMASDAIRLSPNRDLINDKYLLYAINSPYFRKQAELNSTGTTRLRIGLTTLAKLSLLSPPLPEQERIAEILSTVDEQIENTEKLIEKTKELKKGLMQQLLTRGIGHTEFKMTELGEIPVGWEIVNIEQVSTTTSGGTPNRNSKEYFINGSVPWIKTGELKNKYIFSSSEHITENAVKNSSAKWVKPNSVVIAMYGATIGECSILKISATTNQACCVITPIKECLLEEYLYYYLKFAVQSVISLSAGGAQPNISQQLIKKFKIKLPPLAEQQNIAELLSLVDEQIDSYQEEKVKHMELKKGLMQQLLTGQTRVQV